MTTAPDFPRVPPHFDVIGETQRLGLAMRVIADSVDVDGIVRCVEDAHTVGWFLDPTKYRDALQRGDMDAIADLARALQPAVKIWKEKIAPKLTETV